MLDVGCWDGSLLADLPPDVVSKGIEPNPAAAERARAKGLDVVQAFVEDVALDDASYDLITLIDVLEHLPHPREVVVRLSSALRPRGRLVVLTGNAGSPACRFWGGDWYYLHYPEHVSFFTRTSLSRALDVAGLQLVSTQVVRHPTASLASDLRAGIRHIVAKRDDPGDVSLRPQVGTNVLTLSRLVRGRDHLFAVASRS